MLPGGMVEGPTARRRHGPRQGYRSQQRCGPSACNGRLLGSNASAGWCPSDGAAATAPCPPWSPSRSARRGAVPSHFRGSGSRPREKGTHTRPIPRAPRACPIIASSSTRQAATLAQSTAPGLTTWLIVRRSWESEQSKNEVGEMVPLYAARVQDLGPDDVAVFRCGACGHTAELPPSALLRGLGLKPTDKVLDLERRLTETVERRSNTRYGTGMVADQPAREADQYQTHCHGASTGRL